MTTPSACAVSTAPAGLDPAEFRDPGLAYRGVTLWFLNDKLEQGEALRQLRGFKEAGWGAVITRTFMGIRTPYLSADWLDLTDAVLAEAEQLGLRVFLQHADKNAAPYMATGVPGMQERFRHQLVTAAPLDALPPPRSERLRWGERLAYYRQTVVPAGEWAQLMAVLDLLDEDTVKAYLDAAYEPLAARHGRHFGRAVAAVWVDEPWLRIARYSSLPVLPWTTRLPELFERDWGYRLLDHLPELFEPVGDYRRVRSHYWRTVNALFLKAYWEPVGRWCAAHRVQFAGHLMAEDTLNGQIAWTGTVMPSYESMQLPGIDHLTKNLHSWPAGTPFIVTPKQCSSAANQFGRREVLSELYGVSDQALSFEDRKWMAEWLATLGINCRCYHGSFYSLRGRRKRFYPPHLSEQQPWWPDNRLVADPMARLSYALRQGQFDADILVLHPLESAHCEFSPGPQAAAVQALQASWTRLSEALLALHRAYDFGDEHIMARYGRVVEGRLHVGQMAYRTVVLPDLITLRDTTVRLLAELLDAGGTVIAVGAVPTRIDGAEDGRIAALTSRFRAAPNTVDGLGAALAELHPADVGLTGPGAERIWLHPRRFGTTRLLFLNHTDRATAAEVELRLRGRGRLQEWSLLTGEPVAVPQTGADGWVTAPLHFEPGGSHLLEFDEDATPITVPASRREVLREVRLAGPFAVSRRDPNALVLDVCRYRPGAEPWSEPLPIIGVQEKLTDQAYRGPLELLFTFTAEVCPSSCELVLEDSDQCEVTVNGTPVTRRGDAFYRDRGFHRLDITAAVRAGDNRVSVRREYVAGDTNAIRDPERLYGTEVEAAYVIGDFAVRQDGPTHFSITAESGQAGTDLLRAGYPFFCGRLVLSTDLDLPAPEAGESVTLDLGGLHCVLAKVSVNGQPAGAITWAPYEVDITSQLRAGRNHLDIELVTSLRNLLGPLHYCGPRKLEVWDLCFSGRSERVDWMDEPQRRQLKTWTDEYRLVPFGLAEGARLVSRRAR